MGSRDGQQPQLLQGPENLKNPVEQVSWDDCQQFLDKLNANPGPGDGGKFHLPTEGAVGICLPGGEHDKLLLRRR